MTELITYPEKPQHVFNFRVPLSYIDMGGVIFNGNYLDIYDQARDAYFREIGYSYTKLFMEKKCHLSVVEVNIKYKKPVHYDEIIEIVTQIKKTGTKSLIFEQFLFKGQKQHLCNTATFALVCIDATRTPAVLPEDFANAIKQHKKKFQ